MMRSGKWIPYDPALQAISTNARANVAKKVTKKVAAPKKKSSGSRKRKSDPEMEAFFNDDESEESNPELESDGDEQGSESENESEDEEAAFLRAAAEVIGAEEAGLVESPPKKSKHERSAKVEAKEKLAPTPVEEKVKKGKEFVQCDSCNKWRGLPSFVDPEDLPDKWVCVNMQDILCSSRLTCEHGQEPLPEGFESEEEEEESEEVNAVEGAEEEA